jgi:ArsR family transcriptional regulator
MPVADVQSPLPRVLPRVAPSVAAEIFWAIQRLTTGKHWRADSFTTVPQDLLDEVRGFWGGDSSCSGEILVIADAAECVTGTDPEPVFAAVQSPPAIPIELPLASETPADRALTLERLARLTGDRALRKRYADLLRRTWALFEREWEEKGIELCQQAAGRMRERLETGARLDDVLPTFHRTGPWSLQAAAAAAGRRLVLAPTYLGGTFLAWDLPQTYLMGFQAQPQDDVAMIRRRAEQLAGRLKVLGDPTRVAILMWLARRPASVTEIARAFALAQPTVSTHLKLLRDAGLVGSSREDGHSVQTVSREAVSELVELTRGSLIDDC